MRLIEIQERLGLDLLTPESSEMNSVNIAAGHATDLLSDVLAHAPSGAIWVTIQVNMNVVAVAMHAELAAVVFSSGRLPDEDVVKKAAESGIVLFSSAEPTFELVGKLYEMGVREKDA